MSDMDHESLVIDKYGIQINKIHNQDCIEGLKMIKDSCIDCIITDPPYGINKGKIVNDDSLDTWISSLKESYRVLKDNSFYLLFASIAKIPEVCNHMEKAGFKYRWQTLLYIKNGMVRGSVGFSVYYPCLIFMKGDAKIKKPLRDIMEVSTSSKEMKQRIHPYQKDKNFIAKLINSFSKEGDLILDPFMGSATTAISCMETKRDFVGFEIDKKYYDLAIKRLEEAKDDQL